MSGSDSSPPPLQPTQSQTATKDPWLPSQPFLQQTMGSAAGLYNQGLAGSYNPYGGQVLADVHPWQQQGQSAAMGLAQTEPTGSANLAGARGYLGNLIGNEGLNAGLRTAAGQFGNLYSEAAAQRNPYLEDILSAQGRRIGDQVNSAMAGRGRYGSGMHTDVMTRALAESADPILAQDYAQRQQQRMQATGALGDIYSQGLQRAGQAAQLVPQLDAARFANADVMSALGQFYSNRSQAQKSADISVYNALQAYPWENLARYNAIIQGTGGLGGSTVSNTLGQMPQQPSTMQRALGGAVAGAGLGTALFPGIGTGIGAAAGGLLGML
jgi:hypothetical protein